MLAASTRSGCPLFCWWITRNSEGQDTRAETAPAPMATPTRPRVSGGCPAARSYTCRCRRRQRQRRLRHGCGHNAGWRAGHAVRRGYGAPRPWTQKSALQAAQCGSSSRPSSRRLITWHRSRLQPNCRAVVGKLESRFTCAADERWKRLQPRWHCEQCQGAAAAGARRKVSFRSHREPHQL